MGGRAPGASLPLWPYKSKLLTPKSKASHHLLSEGIILFKAINLKNRFRANTIQRKPEFFYVFVSSSAPDFSLCTFCRQSHRQKQKPKKPLEEDGGHSPWCQPSALAL